MNFGQTFLVDFSLSPAHIYGAICIVIVIDISDFYLHHSFTRVHFLHVCFLPLSVSSCDQAFFTSNCRAFIYWCLRLFSACFSACLTDHTCHGFCTCITCLLICRVSIYINIYLYQHLSIPTFIYINIYLYHQDGKCCVSANVSFVNFHILPSQRRSTI